MERYPAEILPLGGYPIKDDPFIRDDGASHDGKIVPEINDGIVG